MLPPPTQPSAVSPIVFYCKDCERIVAAHKIGQQYVYRCAICKTKNVAFGTEKSIKSFYHIKEEVEEEEKKEEVKKEVKKEGGEK